MWTWASSFTSLSLYFIFYKLGYNKNFPIGLCVCVCVHTCMHAHTCSVAQSCLTLCNPVDCSPPGFSVRGTSQVRILKWVAIFPTQGSNLNLLHLLQWRRMLCQLSHQGSPFSDYLYLALIEIYLEFSVICPIDIFFPKVR